MKGALATFTFASLLGARSLADPSPTRPRTVGNLSVLDVDPTVRSVSSSGPTTIAPTERSTALARPRVKRLYVRVGVAHIKPLSTSEELELVGVDGFASLAVENGPIAGSGASMSSATIPALIVGYRLPGWNNRLSLETIVGLPFEVKLKATGTLADESLAPMVLGIPTGVPPLGEELGTAKAAPPTLTLVYNLVPGSRIQPYVGAGLAVLVAYDEKVTNHTLTAVSKPEMSIAPAPGFVLQGGIEAKLSSRISARLDVKFIAFMKARAEVSHVQVSTPGLPLFESVEVGTAEMNVWVNPLIIQAGVGTDF